MNVNVRDCLAAYTCTQHVVVRVAAPPLCSCELVIRNCHNPQSILLHSPEEHHINVYYVSITWKCMRMCNYISAMYV